MRLKVKEMLCFVTWREEQYVYFLGQMGER